MSVSYSSNRVTIDGPYKSGTTVSGSTATTLEITSGEIVSGDIGRLVAIITNASDASETEVRQITAVSGSTVTIHDDWVQTPGSSVTWRVAHTLQDVHDIGNAALEKVGNSSFRWDADWNIINNGFLGDVDKFLEMKSPSGQTVAWPMESGTIVQFGLLWGGEHNQKSAADKEDNAATETTGGCAIFFDCSRTGGTSVYTSTATAITNGHIVNYYGGLVKSATPSVSDWHFQRMGGPSRFIRTNFDGPLGGRFSNTAGEWVKCNMSGNDNNTPAYSIGAVLDRDIDGVDSFQNLSAFKNNSSFSGTFRNCFISDSNTNKFFVDGTAASTIDFVDCTTFVDGDLFDNGSGTLNQNKSINYTITDSSGTGLTGAKVAVYDTDGTLQTAVQTSTSGEVDEILAKFYIWTNMSPSVDKSPFTIRIREYGYQFQEFSSAVSEPIKQEFRLPTNTVTVLSSSAAAALTDIAVDFVAETVTITAARTLSQIYDYCQTEMDADMSETAFLSSADGVTFTFADNWKLILGASGDITGASGKTVVFGGTGEIVLNDAGNNIDGLTVTGDMSIDAAVGTIDSITVSGAVDFGVAATFTIDDSTINEVTNSSGGSVVIDRNAGTTITTNTGPNITINAPSSSISITGMPTDGANIRLQVSNETAKTASSWAATTAYSTGDKVLRSTGLGSENTLGLYYVCTVAGTSGGSEPTFPTTVGGTVVDGSVTWTCYAILYYDNDPASSSYSDNYIDGEEFKDGDTYGIRFAEMNGATSFKIASTTGLVGSLGFTVQVNEQADSVYALNAVDGSSSTVTDKFTADYTNSEIDLDANQDYKLTEAFAYYCYELTTSQGMGLFWGGVTAIDTANYRNNSSVVGILFDETSGFVKQTDSGRWFREDGTRPAKDPTTGGAGIEINWRNPVYAYDAGGGGFTSGDRSTLESIPSAAEVVNEWETQSQADPTGFQVNVKEMNDATVAGSGTDGDKWRGV